MSDFECRVQFRRQIVFLREPKSAEGNVDWWQLSTVTCLRLMWTESYPRVSHVALTHTNYSPPLKLSKIAITCSSSINFETFTQLHNCFKYIKLTPPFKMNEQDKSTQEGAFNEEEMILWKEGKIDSIKYN